ncbi:MAG: DNA-binding protein [Verrucomicrobia bacterium]|nr:DNA-binding protein [Verrucomicrobiota bacterium]
MKTHALRLRPGEDVKLALKTFTAEKGIKAGAIVTAVGSLSQASLRYAGRPTATRIQGDMEILALVGTLCPDGPHLHLTVGDADGKTLGGHVMDGCIVRTTCELVISEYDNFTFTRELDPATGYQELVVNTR